MSDLSIVSAEELRPLLDVILSERWPIPFDEIGRLFARLGWERTRESGGETTLPVSLRMVSVGRLAGDISELSFRVTDTLPRGDARNPRILDAAFPVAEGVVPDCLGFAPTGTPWVDPGSVWDLVDGRQVRLIGVRSALSLDIWSTALAEIERHEQRHGQDPGKNLDDRP